MGIERKIVRVRFGLRSTEPTTVHMDAQAVLAGTMKEK